MKQESFIKYIKGHQKIYEIIDRLNGTGICLIDYNESFYKALNALEKELFNQIAIDLINDFIWSTRAIEISDSITREVIFTINSPETLWEYISTNDLLIKQ